MSFLYSHLTPCVIDSKRSSERAGNQSQLIAHPVPGPSTRASETVIAEAVSGYAEEPYPYLFPEQLAPVQQELDSHKAQLTDLGDKVSSLIETFEAKIRNLTSEIQDLRARAKSSPGDSSMTMGHEHSVRLPEPPSTPKRVRTPYHHSIAYVSLPHLSFPTLSRIQSSSHRECRSLRSFE